VVGKSGILGVDHVAVVTSRVEEAEKHYAELFEARVLFRGATQRGIWVTIDGEEDWTEIRRHGIRIEGSFLRAGGLTISVIDESPPAKTGPINHVGIGCSDAEVRSIKERVKRAGLRILEDGAEGFKFLDGFAVVWEVSRGMELRRSGKRLDLGTGRVG
jgi:catechol 2,3-dioxygenase-like lactoylglutathione lyase family enzyme